MRRMISSALVSGALAAVGGLNLAPSAAQAGGPGSAFSLSVGHGSGSGFSIAYGSAYGPIYGPPVGYGGYASYERYEHVGGGGPPRGSYCRHHDRWGCSCRPTPPPPCHQPPPPPSCGVPRGPRPYDWYDGYDRGYRPPSRGESFYRYESGTVRSAPFPMPYRPYGY